MFQNSTLIFNELRTYGYLSRTLRSAHAVCVCACVRVRARECDRCVFSDVGTTCYVIITGNSSLKVRPAPRSSVFNPAPVSVGFVVYKVALGQVFLTALPSAFPCHCHSTSAPHTVRLSITLIRRTSGLTLRTLK
jgi:hypothetical protein